MYFNHGQGFVATKPEKSVRLSSAARTFTNLVAAETEINAGDRAVMDLRDYSECSLTARVQTAGVTGLFKLEYSLDGSTWATLTSSLSLAATGHFNTPWVPIPGEARAIVSVRMVGYNGDTIEDPAVGAGVVLNVR